ncbi:coiled-coil domain-containing protein R3HCC1L [Diorhabda carinulata]|uniref:coiled-coil domain-containing protein R3HCC1L n=1 Tax=Diorhabda carinulata TaxID=1163345 RepID=UPI0025A0266C|nr:coiled-coil domain-containing protein R3HCC1L [Diorhabda carinulata]
MSIYTDVDNILKILSTKFHKIFCDREFVCSVQEDFQVILKNRNKCCVVVFPVLCPNYLKAVQYQAKIFDLEVFTLGSGQICSLAVCDKKFLLKKTEDSDKQIMSSIEQECGAGITSKKKRPERQLYIPPAQRRLPVSELPINNTLCSSKGKNLTSTLSKRKELQKKENIAYEYTKVEPEYSTSVNEIFNINTINAMNNLKYFSYMWWKYELFECTNLNIFKYVSTKSFFNKKIRCNLNPDVRKIFNLENKTTLYILRNDYFLWQPKVDVFMNCKESNLKVVPLTNLDNSNVKRIDVCDKIPLADNVFRSKTYSDVLEEFNLICDVDVFWLQNRVDPSNLLDICFSDIYYYEDYYYEKLENIGDFISKILYNEDNCDERQSKTHVETQEIKIPDDIEETEIDNTPIDNKNELSLEQNKKKVNTSKSNLNNLKNTINLTENAKLKNDLEEEKEIMRKTKENINRKTRPIMKYVDDSNHTLKIESNDVNNWEDLFDEDGQLQEDLLKEIVTKVGEDVTIVKAKEDYSDYFSKHVNIEELEHMVELYDFPASLGTHDLIHAFSEIKSDAMYIKWVDDTHAILVLGSSSQAQKAINVKNPLIKVRPMPAASKTALSIAYRNELKPAMKRPPTNLQTARRLITTHLGTKSGISKELSAKERDDLKAAREMKRLVKKNEQDAWDGNLRSSMD